MPIPRRDLLVAGALAPLLASRATDLSRFGQDTPPALAATLGICAASYVTLAGGRPGAPVVLSGCAPDQPVQDGAIFQAASLTKPVIAFATLKLVREGRLDLRAPVSRYLPDGYAHRQHSFGGAADNPADRVPASTLARIPLATLLNHSSGLPNWTTGMLAPEFTPGERWQYSGEAYVLLQAVIGAVTGQDIESVVSRTVFEPLGMRHTRLRLADDIREQAVSGSSWLGGRTQFDFLEPNAAASLYTTAQDYALLIAALWADAALMSLTMADPVSVDLALGLTWGRGWGIEAAAGGPYLWHWGNNPGFRSFAMV
ncbi:MAG: class A beta-lactamase-related serine hydrolase [Aquabacterium sp.]|nr:MAG: class A beta-lactamase-related serine hydrolase [Aquabacterium sp.]